MKPLLYAAVLLGVALALPAAQGELESLDDEDWETQESRMEDDWMEADEAAAEWLDLAPDAWWRHSWLTEDDPGWSFWADYPERWFLDEADDGTMPPLPPTMPGDEEEEMPDEGEPSEEAPVEEVPDEDTDAETPDEEAPDEEETGDETDDEQTDEEETGDEETGDEGTVQESTEEEDEEEDEEDAEAESDEDEEEDEEEEDEESEDEDE